MCDVKMFGLGFTRKLWGQIDFKNIRNCIYLKNTA